jgi:hypothetical protein
LDNSILQLQRNPRQQHSSAAVRFFWSRTERYDEANPIATQVIPEDPELVGGENVGLVRWAMMTQPQVSDARRVPVPDVRAQGAIWGSPHGSDSQ